MSDPSPAVVACEVAAAEIVFCAGAGVADVGLLAHAAREFDAVVAGSAPQCDGRRLPAARLVGASGSYLTAACYVGFGVHGAPHHVAGIDEVPVVVSVNHDPDAPIHARAELSIVADAEAVLARLADRPAPGLGLEARVPPNALTPWDRRERLLLPRAGRGARLTTADPGSAAAAIAALVQRVRTGSPDVQLP